MAHFGSTISGCTFREGATSPWSERAARARARSSSLLLRFHDPTAGAVLIDGRDLRSVTQASWRAQVGIVFQDSILFHTSIRENIRLGNLRGLHAAGRVGRPCRRDPRLHRFIAARL